MFIILFIAHVPSLPQRENNWEAFYAWCLSQDAKFGDITFKEIKNENFGAVADKDIKVSLLNVLLCKI